MSRTMATHAEENSILGKLDAVAPIAKFDAFPKLPSTYKARSESRGIITMVVAFLAFLLVLNDVVEYMWGWPDQEFSVDDSVSSLLNINLDMVVAMPCGFLSVDLRDAMGDRLFLSGGLRRDGALFDVDQAVALVDHAQAQSVQQVVAQSRKSRGLFAWITGRNKDLNKPSYNHTPDGSACRIAGTLVVKKVTANLHITTLGHGYASYEHVDHNKMNLSHIITEFSFGPYFPNIVQPLDNTFESTDKNFIAYQYFLHIVPTTYVAPRSSPLHTNQYSVTHYTREVAHDRGTPGIFFKFELDPLAITVHQRTPTFLQLLIRVVGVLGGVFVCMGYAIRITTRAVEVVSGADHSPGIVAAEASGVKVGGLRAKWGGSELRARAKLVPQGTGWTVEGSPGLTPNSASPYSAGYAAGTPTTAGMYSPGFSVPATPNPYSVPPTPQSTTTSAFGPPPTPSHMSRSSSSFGPPRTAPGFTPRSSSGSGGNGFPSVHVTSPSVGNGNGISSEAGHSPYGAPSPYYNGSFPTSPNPTANGNGSHAGPPPKAPGKKDD